MEGLSVASGTGSFDAANAAAQVDPTLADDDLDRNHGHGHHHVPEPGTLVLMAMVLMSAEAKRSLHRHMR